MKLNRKSFAQMSSPLKALVVTAMALLLSHVAVYDLMDVSFFAPMQKASDFRFSDFYTLVANDRAERVLDENVVIVSVDGCNRTQMARALDDIDFCAPAAVGLDIAFNAPSDPDSDPLPESLASCENLVMPLELNDKGEIVYSYYDSIVTPSAGFACVNIQGDKESRSTIREFCSGFDVDGKFLPSLPMALVSLADREAAARLRERNNADEAIDFVSRDFLVIPFDSIIDHAGDIEDRVVLVGKMKDVADTHSTPISNFTPGLSIHAHTIATILSGDFTRRLSSFEMYLSAFLLCFFVGWLNIVIGDTPLGSFGVRFVQLLLLYCMILIGTWAFVRYNVDLNFAYMMLTTSLCVVACDIYNGIFGDEGLIVKFHDIIFSVNEKISNFYESYKSKRALSSAVADDPVDDNVIDCSGISEGLQTEGRCD